MHILETHTHTKWTHAFQTWVVQESTVYSYDGILPHTLTWKNFTDISKSEKSETKSIMGNSIHKRLRTRHKLTYAVRRALSFGKQDWWLRGSLKGFHGCGWFPFLIWISRMVTELFSPCKTSLKQKHMTWPLFLIFLYFNGNVYY